MYGVNEIKKANHRQKVEKEKNEKRLAQTRYALQRNGEVLLRYGVRTHTLEGDDAKEFVELLRGQSEDVIAKSVEDVFAAVSGARPPLTLLK